MAKMTDWSELAIALYDKLTQRGAEIACEFEDLELHVPTSADPGREASQAVWKVNGTLRISTRDRGTPQG